MHRYSAGSHLRFFVIMNAMADAKKRPKNTKLNLL